MNRTPRIRSQEHTRSINLARFADALRDGLTIPALAERFALSLSQAAVLRRRILVAASKAQEAP